MNLDSNKKEEIRHSDRTERIQVEPLETPKDYEIDKIATLLRNPVDEL